MSGSDRARRRATVSGDAAEALEAPHWSERPRVAALLGARGRPLGVVLLLVLVALLLAPETPPVRLLRLAGFDAYQSLLPRVRASAPAIIVEIDETSLASHGQWPWPRTLLARLVETIAAGGPAAIGIDLLMPESDRLSPDRLAAVVAGTDRDLAERLRRLPSNDAVLADAIRGLPVVVGVAGVEQLEPTAAPSGLRAAPMRSFGGDPRPFIKRYVAALRSVDPIDAAAAGHGHLGLDVEAGVARRMPLAAAIGQTTLPAFGLEMLRVASDEPTFAVHVGGGGVRAVGVGDLVVPTQPDGSVWIHYSRTDRSRFVSASDVLVGRVDGRVFERKLVLIGVTALGLSDDQATPVGDRVPGVEIHAQLLEGIFDGDILFRPRWVLWLEAATLLVSGLVLVWAVPALPVKRSVAVLVPVIAVPLALAFGFYLKLHALYDAASPVAGLTVLFTALLGLTLAEAEGQRRGLRRLVARQREDAARLAGELAAARRIQMGSLPSPAAAFPDEKRLDLFAYLEPAREVGGDLYDFFRLDADRICLLIGDVSGKGLPGSLFMAMSKSLFKSIALGGHGDIGSMMREADRQISRDNAEGLFVTVWAGILHLETGELEYCDAGHDRPYVLAREDGRVTRLPEAGGPPLCVLEDFGYASASHRMTPGEMLCLVTDGVTEATRVTGEFYGRQRLESLLSALSADADVEAVGEAIHRDVARFAAGVDPADDVAIVVLRWNGAASDRAAALIGRIGGAQPTAAFDPPAGASPR